MREPNGNLLQIQSTVILRIKFGRTVYKNIFWLLIISVWKYSVAPSKRAHEVVANKSFGLLLTNASAVEKRITAGTY